MLYFDVGSMFDAVAWLIRITQSWVSCTRSTNKKVCFCLLFSCCSDCCPAVCLFLAVPFILVSTVILWCGSVNVISVAWQIHYVLVCMFCSVHVEPITVTNPCLLSQNIDLLCLGLEILAFPCNQFGAQEPGSNEQIQDFVCTRFKAEFPVFNKVKKPLLILISHRLWFHSCV